MLPEGSKTPESMRFTLLAQIGITSLVIGVVVCSGLVSVAAGSFATVKLAYGFLVVTSGASIVMNFLALHARSKFWRNIAIGGLAAGIVALVYAVRMLSLAYTFQMNIQ
jgi:hypothetical protein